MADISIKIGVNCVPFKNPKVAHRQKMAIQVLLANKSENTEVINFCFPNEHVDECKDLNTLHLKRNSKNEIGNQRSLPYIKEIMDTLSGLCDDNDVFGYMNSDILLSKDFFNIFKEGIDAYVFSRTEITEIDSVNQFNKGNYKKLWGGDTHAGADAFFFRCGWWVKNRNLFHNDLILGETEWDTVYRHIAFEAKHYLHERALLHVYHDAKWDVNSIGGKNNIQIWEKVKHDYA